jgi:hypothetical protein
MSGLAFVDCKFPSLVEVAAVLVLLLVVVIDFGRGTTINEIAKRNINKPRATKPAIIVVPGDL